MSVLPPLPASPYYNHGPFADAMASAAAHGHRPYLDPNPVAKPDPDVRITAIETAIPTTRFPGLLLIRIHTNTGLIGHGETYYAPHAVASLIHDWMARRLLGNDALAIESHWRWFYERCANFGVRGAELRAISAIDLALWDILGQVARLPVYRLLGGPVRDRIPVYNSCGNPSYGPSKTGAQGWPGYGTVGHKGALQDSWMMLNDPESLAAELIEEGYTAVKTWCFDYTVHRTGGMHLHLKDLDRDIEPLRRLRAYAGNRLEFMVDGHGFFMLPAAIRIADALRELRPLWLEDILKMDNLDTLADFRRQSRMPLSVSEMLLTRPDFAHVLETRGCDYVQIDPTWAGGISESVRIAHMAQAYNIPVCTHDCTGPLTVFAGLHINAVVPGACFQETVRAHIRTVYPDLIDSTLKISQGHCDLPEGPGLGVRLNPDIFDPTLEGYRITRLE